MPLARPLPNTTTSKPNSTYSQLAKTLFFSPGTSFFVCHHLYRYRQKLASATARLAEPRKLTTLHNPTNRPKSRFPRSTLSDCPDRQDLLHKHGCQPTRSLSTRLAEIPSSQGTRSLGSILNKGDSHFFFPSPSSPRFQKIICVPFFSNKKALHHHIQYTATKVQPIPHPAQQPCTGHTAHTAP